VDSSPTPRHLTCCTGCRRRHRHGERLRPGRLEHHRHVGLRPARRGVPARQQPGPAGARPLRGGCQGSEQGGPAGAGRGAARAHRSRAGALRIAWTSMWDRDDPVLTWELLRGSTVSTSTVLASGSTAATWWNRPAMGLVDPSAPAGSTQTYRVRYTDPDGNRYTTPGVTGTVPEGTSSTSAYASAVRQDAPTSWWRLGEASGTTAFSWVSSDDLTLASTVRARRLRRRARQRCLAVPRLRQPARCLQRADAGPRTRSRSRPGSRPTPPAAARSSASATAGPGRAGATTGTST
jgi:hypothetical protein